MPTFSSLKSMAQGKEKNKEIPSGFDWTHAKAALALTANIAEGTGLTPLKIVAGTVKNIVEIAETVGIANLQQGQKDIQEKLAGIEKKYNQQGITSDQLLQATPVVPRIFLGRDLLIKKGSDYITNNAQAFLAILGPGGIGKTALVSQTVSILFPPLRPQTQYYFTIAPSSQKPGVKAVQIRR
ncbi:hypothetical protein K435DRAFT_849590 [Dendrothele bispora CBS 962.96]|uniref:Uncharacterized protein n=1 Tax=Dendrothele bispora (strain CBS 962.96) TaxID=1314807 RepID=A0A4S8MRT9_DENBC|nr:hypothetical protein K435DRAFT_849590 [Dendrothele bispora CBS 962.96]